MPLIPIGIMTLIGGLIALFGTRALRRANAARDWPRVDGDIVASYIHESRNSKGTTMYRPVVKYSYDVQGKAFASERVRFGGPVSTSWRSPADRVIATYPMGQSCRVYYNPDDHTEACLHPGAGWVHYLVAGIGFLLALIGTTILLG